MGRLRQPDSEHLSLLVAQPHHVVNFTLALVSRVTGERCCAGDVRPAVCRWGLVSVSLLCTCCAPYRVWAGPHSGMTLSLPQRYVAIPKDLLGTRRLVGPRQAVSTSAVVAQVRIWQGCLLGWCWLRPTTSCTCWWHK